MFQKKQRQLPFLHRKSFNNSNIVSDIKTYKGEEAKNIKPVERKTETTGYETGVFREVFSNFGRMSSKKPT